MATFTNTGVTLLATSLQGLVTYVGLGTGCGTLASTLTSGVAYTALPLAAALPAGLSSGQSLTLIDSGGDTQTVTTSGAVLAGATSIPVTSFTASATFAAGSGVTPTPGATDTALYNETYRLPALAGVAGASPGESLLSAYFDPTTPSATYLEVGYFGGSATGSTGTGTLLARDAQFWAHTAGADSASPQIDATISVS